MIVWIFRETPVDFSGGSGGIMYVKSIKRTIAHVNRGACVVLVLRYPQKMKLPRRL